MSISNVISFPDPPERRASILGRFLCERRKALKLSREGLIAKILVKRHVRISSGAIAKIEKGMRLPLFATLDLIADGLDFGPDERAHVMALIDERPLPPVASCQEVPAPVLRVVHYLDRTAAYVIDRKLDIRAFNAATCDLYGFQIEDVDPEDCNVAWVMFNSPFLAAYLVDWDSHAKRIVAQCRAHWAGREHDPEIRKILDRMLGVEQFATWWNEPTVKLRSAVEKIVNHPKVGQLRLEQTVFPVADNPDLDMVVTMPLDEDTVTKLDRLAELRGTPA